MIAGSAANSESFKVSTPSDHEIRMTRVFDAPRQLVFEAMTKPEHIKEWWGRLGEGYSVPVCEVDFRVGGKWRFVSAGPDRRRSNEGDGIRSARRDRSGPRSGARSARGCRSS